MKEHEHIQNSDRLADDAIGCVESKADRKRQHIWPVCMGGPSVAAVIDSQCFDVNHPLFRRFGY